MKNAQSTIGLIIALTALIIAIFQEDVSKMFYEPEEVSLTETLKRKGIEYITEEEILSPAEVARKNVSNAYKVIGIIGLILGITGFIRKENWRFAAAVAVIAIMAITWEFFIIGIASGAFLIIIFAYFNSYI